MIEIETVGYDYKVILALAAGVLAVFLGIAAMAWTAGNSPGSCKALCGPGKVAVCGREIRCKP